MDKKILTEIDNAIRYIWEYEIKQDYDNDLLINEDTLKNALYFHIRTKLSDLLEKHNIKIFTELTNGKFAGSRRRPDMALVRIDNSLPGDYLGDGITEYICIIEIKFQGDNYRAAKVIYDDYDKIKCYIENMDLNCPLYYMATIWEAEDTATTWARKNAAWAKDKLTELNASYENGDMRFYIGEHKGKQG